MEFPALLAEKEELVQDYSARTGIDTDKIRVIASPYRISPLGAHIDHQGGPVLGMTVNAYSLLVYVPTPDGEINLASFNYPGCVTFHVERVPENCGSFWGVYMRGAVLALKERYPLRYGLSGVIKGHLPGGGLSSSASVLLAYLWALADVNGISLNQWDFVDLTQRAENIHIGLNNGILDQTSIVFGQQGHLLHIDTLNRHVDPIPEAARETAYRFLIAFSGYTRELTTTGYNSRVSECRQAAQMLSDGNPGGAQKLGDVSAADFESRGSRLPAHLFRRARHFFSEVERVRQGVKAWQAGEIERFGRLMNASCRSSIEQYECGSQPIHDLQMIVSQTDGIIGSRFSGGGFGGCVVGLVRKTQAEAAVAQIKSAYQKHHPEVARETEVYLAASVDGVTRL